MQEKWLKIFKEVNLNLEILPSNWKDECIELGQSINICNQKFFDDSTAIPLYRVKNPSNSRDAFWKCYCENDKKYFICNGRDLKRGHTKSCGCLRKKVGTEQLKKVYQKQPYIRRKDYTGQNFDTHLTAVRYDHTENNQAYWAFQCDCGNPELFITKIAYVYSHDTTHCPNCQQRFLGPAKIEKILKENNIPFIKEKTFSDCKYKGLLRFDFYINNSYCIEYNGLQHYKPSSGYHEGKFELYQIRDKIKINYCKEKNIPLIIIPYTHLKQIKLEDLLLETSTFIIS